MQPITGRKHQLRRHMAHISHPIVGDTTHGDGRHNKFLREQFGFKGLALTCSSISLTHPVDESLLEIKTDLDPRLVKLLNQWDCSGSQLKEVMKK